MDWNKLVRDIILVLSLGGISLSFLFLRNKRKEIALVLFSFVFAILIAEVVLKLFYPQIMEHDKMFKYDPSLGWRFISNKKGAIVYPGEARHYIETNYIGFRDDPPPPDKDNLRKILVLGDSFVSNIQVKDSEVFTEVLEQRLKNTSVLNFGVPGYGQIQEYLLLQKWLRKINPDLIILVIYISNDFNDNVGGYWNGSYWNYPRPSASWSEEDRTLKINPPPQPTKEATSEPFWKCFFFYRKSHCYTFLDRRIHFLITKFSQADQSEHKPSLYTPSELYLCRSQPSENTKLMYRTMEELLLRIAGYADEIGVPLVFAIATSMVQVEDELWSSTVLNYGGKLEDYIRTLPNDKLMQFAEKNNLLMIDLLPILQSEAKKGKTLYNRREGHWNSDGNRVVAGSLLGYLKAKSLIE
jgi:hypothetical protein